MSIHDEQDLRGQLGAALDGLAPGPLPLAAVVRQGRMVMIRKRVAVAACVAVLAAVGVAGPTLAREIGTSEPATGTYHVFEYPPGTGSPKDLIASGRLGKLRWRMIGKWQGPGHQNDCVGINGSFNCVSGPPDKIQLTGPITNFDSGLGKQVFIGSVRGDVTRLLVTLTNGQLLSLHPVKVFGQRYAGYVGLVLPRAATVTMITGYSGRREIGYEIPFTKFARIVTLILLKPGQPPLPRPHTYLIGSGAVRGWRWKEHLYVGPWGSCVGHAATGWNCFPTSPPGLAEDFAVRLLMSVSRANSQDEVAVFAVARQVSYLRVNPGHGAAAFTARCSNVAGARMCVFGSLSGARWIAYAADGTKLGSGRI